MRKDEETEHGFRGSGFKKKMFDVHLSMMIGLAGLDSAGPVDLL